MAARTDDSGDSDDEETRRVGTIGGRHGSPTVNVSLPFSKLSFGDDGALGDAVETLGALVGQLADQVRDLAARADDAEVRAGAEQISAEVTELLDDLAERD